MRFRDSRLIATAAAVAALLPLAWTAASPAHSSPFAARQTAVRAEVEPAALTPFLGKGLSWLVKAQHANGGWGAGSHAAQQLRDPHGVKTDPATTAFVGLALLRSGHTPDSGSYREPLRRATKFLVDAVRNSSDTGPLVTDLSGTQLQTKLGRYVDTALTTQFLSRVLTTLTPDDELHAPVDAALDKCLRKLAMVQGEDGSASGGGWAPVLQSSLALSALEMAGGAGKAVDAALLDRARGYGKGAYLTGSNRAAAGDAAGVELYSYSGAQRAAAVEARIASEAVAAAKRKGVLAPDAEVSEKNLADLGVPNARAAAAAYRQLEAQDSRIIADDQLLSGFGSNGGEEFLSYLLTSESMVLSGSDEWPTWNGRMRERLAAIQNPDGSWSGHHCITSPVFCTAAVLLCLTADRDAEVLRSLAQKTAAGTVGG